jgi:16S rRNA (cytosine967-C5)-methyltransferase
LTGARKKPRAEAPGFSTRKIAATALFTILQRGRPLDEVIDPATGIEGLAELSARDRALVRMLVATVLRRLGTLRALLDAFLESGLPKSSIQLEIALLLGAAQILFLDVPDHAAVDLSVRLASEQRNKRYAGLANAVLRRIAQDGAARLASIDPDVDAPAWLLERWQDHYGKARTSEILTVHKREPSLDLTAKSHASEWAERLGGHLLPTGSIRLLDSGPIVELPGYEGGHWWVQDAAAALPARLLGDVAGRSVVDLCAAPGGKTAQLAVGGAHVVAVDRSESRLGRMKQNLERLNIEAELVAADATKWVAEPFDAVLLDAPCTATGTVRRHPDIPWQKRPEDVAKLSALQSRLLDRAATLTRPGGLLVYATCSLEPEEGELQIDSFLAKYSGFVRVPIGPAEVGGEDAFVTERGDLRSLPFHFPNANPRLVGCDGFYSARLRRLS